jgi:hypothetical protein
MVNETPGLTGAFSRAAVRGAEMRARASGFVDATAERGRRIYDGAVNETADAMSAASDTVESVGEQAHSTGKAIRKSSRRAARAIHRGERNLRASDPAAITATATAAMRRHTFAFAMAGAAVLAFLTMKVLRRRSREA